MKKNILISIWEWQNRFSVQTMSHIRVHQHSTWGTWPLPRGCWVHPERMSKAPHPDCSECTAPCSAIAREMFKRETLADLHLSHHFSWRGSQGGLPLHRHSGKTANLGKSLLVPVGFAQIPPRYLFSHQTPLSLIWHASFVGFKPQNKLQ